MSYGRDLETTDAGGISWFRRGTAYISVPAEFVIDRDEFDRYWVMSHRCYGLVSWWSLFSASTVTSCMRAAEIHRVLERFE